MKEYSPLNRKSYNNHLSEIRWIPAAVKNLKKLKKNISRADLIHFENQKRDDFRFKGL